MASVNQVILLGNLGRDPEIRFLPNGDPVANITIATSSRYKSKTGELVEETEWHRVTFFGRLAEIANQYLKKGNPVYVEGRIKTRKYTDKDGIEKYATDIIASEMQLLGGREAGSGSGTREEDADKRTQAPAARPAPQQPPRPAPQPARQATAAAPATRPDNSFVDMDDDIPF
jgi:single-strand DNA-binding protein